MDGQKGGYFESALSDFVFEVAAGGAIRHLADRGYSIEQIMRELDYPVPRDRVEKAVYRHLMDTGILLSSLPENEKKVICCIQSAGGTDKSRFMAELACHIEKYGEKNSYMECPFGIWRIDHEKKLDNVMEQLSLREREYILGIKWEYGIMYHRLNDRMREIGMKLAANTDEKWKYFFFVQK